MRTNPDISINQRKVLTLLHVAKYLKEHGFPSVGIGKMYGAHDQLFIFLPDFETEDFLEAAKQLNIDITLERQEEE